MARFSWKINRGRHFSATTYTLRKDGVEYAMVQSMGSEKWFAYSMTSGHFFNSCGSPTSLEEAKKYAKDQIVEFLKSQGEA